jgi:hypothetical protein
VLAHELPSASATVVRPSQEDSALASLSHQVLLGLALVRSDGQHLAFGRVGDTSAIEANRNAMMPTR